MLALKLIHVRRRGPGDTDTHQAILRTYIQEKCLSPVPGQDTSWKHDDFVLIP